jgi:hypothetical protein
LNYFSEGYEDDYGVYMGGDVYFQVRGEQVDIRKCIKDIKSGDLEPTTRGVTLSLKTYAVLIDSLEELSKTLNFVCQDRDSHLNIPLGANAYASVHAPYRAISLRQWYRDHRGTLKPGESISFNTDLWQKFMRICYGPVSL